MKSHPRRTAPPLRRIAGPAVCAASALVLTACGSGAAPTAAAPSAAPSAATGPAAMTITLANSGGADTCTPDTTSVPAGPVTVTVKNESAAGITEVELLKDQRILGEKENLAPGLAPVSFTVTLDGGAHQIYCPGADQDHVDFTVTGQAAPAPTGSVQSILAQGTKDYATYVNGQIDAMSAAVGELNTAVQAGDVEQAKAAYAKARPPYERAESNVEGFVLPGFEPEDNAGNLDYLVDMRESTPPDPAVGTSGGWSGLHAVERDLWQKGAITDETKKFSADLVTNVGKLKEVVGTLEYKPEDLANGAADLLEEVQSGKISGEEEAYSHLDLVDFSANVEGAQQAYASLRPGLQQIDGDLVGKLDQQFQSVLSGLDAYRDPNALGGFTPYTPELKASDSAKLTALIQPLHDSLSAIAQKVV
jgi:iron uptake system component EfeO